MTLKFHEASKPKGTLVIPRILAMLGLGRNWHLNDILKKSHYIHAYNHS